MVVESEELKTSFGRQGNKLIPHFPAFLVKIFQNTDSTKINRPGHNIRTVWSSELDTLLMRYEVNLTPGGK